MKFKELNGNELCKAPDELLELIDKCQSVYYTLLPSNNPFFIKSKAGGYIVYKGYQHYINAMVFGNVAREDLNVDDPVFWFFPTNDKKVEGDYKLFDFIVDWDFKKVKKCKIKNSYNRIISDSNIVYKIYNGDDDMFWFENKAYEIDELLTKWKNASNSDVPITLSNIMHFVELKNKNLIKIAYRENEKLSGLQIFEVVGDSIYWQVSVCLRGEIGKSLICWTHPIEYFNYKPIHYLGALTGQDNLFSHKMRRCDGKFVKFKRIVVPTIAQNEKRRKEMLNELYNHLNI